MRPEDELDSPDSLSSTPEERERKWAMAAHLSGFVCLLGIPFGNVLGPLIIWIWKRDTMPFLADQAKEALNFQISFIIYLIVGALSVLILIGVLLLPILVLGWGFLMINACIKAGEGIRYRYPYTLRLID